VGRIPAYMELDNRSAEKGLGNARISPSEIMARTLRGGTAAVTYLRRVEIEFCQRHLFALIQEGALPNGRLGGTAERCQDGSQVWSA
jgi:hypothetical protein